MTPPTPEDAAFALFESGRLAESERAWREILARKPADPDALHMLGYIVATTGRAQEGLALLDRAVEIAPRVAGIRSNRAMVLASVGRNAEAERDIRRALELEPRLPAALYLLGNIRQQQGRAEEALVAYRRALAIDPRMAPAHVGLGNALLARGERVAARQSYEAALAIDPRDAATHCALGIFREATGDPAGAQAAYRSALEHDPGHVAALNNLGVLMRVSGREEEANARFTRALELAPLDPDVLNNVGLLHHRAGRYPEAAAFFERAAAARPAFGLALVNWANTLQEQGLADAARARYTQALEVQPGLVEARYGRAQLALRQGRFAEGWQEYESRFEMRPPFAVARDFGLPALEPANLAGAKGVAISAEQGLGDQVLYSTLLTEFEARGIPVTAEIDARLLAAYARRFPAMKFVAPGSDISNFEGCDRQVCVASLPRFFRPTLASFEAQPRALLRADDARSGTVREELGPGRWIGISWRSVQGGERKALAEGKSIPLEAFAPLAQLPGVKLLDLQYGEHPQERAEFSRRHPGTLTRLEGLDARNDLEGVLAALAACERVITSSNALAHLAGALGRPTWLVLLAGRAPFHYWVPGPGSRSLWYPSVEIVTDAGWSTWPQALEMVAERLARES